MAENAPDETRVTSSLVEKVLNIADGDIATTYYRGIDGLAPEELADDEVKVRKLVDWHIMPAICFTYCIQFLDKSSLNYASAYSFIPDLDLTGQRYSWVAAIFNFGYLFWATPANLLLQRLPVAKYTSAMIMSWAILVLCHVAATNYAGILVLRFLLGMAESAISPALINICCLWYTRSEQPLRLSIFLAFSGLAVMVGSLLSFGLGHSHQSGLKSWQLIFLTIGLLNFVWSIVFFLIMPDSPTNARFLTPRQRIVAIHRISANMIGVKNKRFKRDQALEALTDYKVYCLSLIALAGGTIAGGVSNFASALIKGFGFSSLNATLLQFPTGAIEFVVVPICGLIASYVPDSRCIVLGTVCLIPFAGLLGIRFTDLDHHWSLVGCAWLQGIFGAPLIIALNLLNTNVAGHTKRSMANGLAFTFYAAGNIAGANIFFRREAPRYFSAITGLCVCYGGIILLAAVLYVSMRWENLRKAIAVENDGNVGDGNGQVTTNTQANYMAIEDGFNDVTDGKGKYFRYAL